MRLFPRFFTALLAPIYFLGLDLSPSAHASLPPVSLISPVVSTPMRIVPETEAPSIEPRARAEVNPGLRQLREEVRELTEAHGGRWSYDFTFVRADGTSEVLSGSNQDALAIPASTLKVIPAWFAFREGVATDRYLARMLKKSDNRMANGLTRRLGGAQRLEETLRQDPLLRDSAPSLRLVDGSGLSTLNRITAGAEVLFLRSILASRHLYDGFKMLLARPGQRGTLRARFAPVTFRENLYAKTGTLPDAGVASLAGFLETDKGVVVFSIIGNDLNEVQKKRGRYRKVRRFRLGRQTIDRIVGLHAAYADEA